MATPWSAPRNWRSRIRGWRSAGSCSCRSRISRRTCAIRSRNGRSARCSAARRPRQSGCYTRRSTVQDLYAALKRYWGYDSFRPMQERIIQSLLTGGDAAVVMPTGGGKSLCYQLPALVLGQTVVVISPLIALMQDQVAQLGDMGIPAALLNSSQSIDEQRQVMRAATQGAFRLLYLSPERLARQDTIAWLQRLPLAFFAIDEAHCISEWGHEFRPEYRPLSSLPHNFPHQPIAPVSASAA